MRYLDRSRSWTVTENDPDALVHALYARDASGLDVEMDDPIPALDPAAEVEDRFAVHATPEAAAEWPRWWQTEVDLGLAPAPDQPDLWFAGRLVGPDLRALLTQTAFAVNRWQRARQREHADLLAHRTPSQRLLVTHLVAEVERDLGRRAAAFNLKIGVLPVEGIWSCRPRVDHVLVSRELRGDDAAFRGFLAPIIRSLG
jgi:hypothetical protein